MRRQTRTWILGAGLLAASLYAAAPAPALAAAGGDTAGTIRVGLNLVPEPFGQFTVAFGNVSISQDTAFAFGFAPYLDYVLHPNVFLGFSPVYSVHVNSDNSTRDSGQQLDLLLRAGAQFPLPIAPGLSVFGYLAPGYSVIIVPNSDNPSGFVLGLHGGVTYDLSGKVYALFQLGYQWGYQSVSTGDAKDEFFQFGLGIGSRI